MTDQNAVVRAFAAMASDKKVFIHELSACEQRWHYGDCFPDVETCAIRTGEDLDERDN